MSESLDATGREPPSSKTRSPGRGVLGADPFADPTETDLAFDPVEALEARQQTTATRRPVEGAPSGGAPPTVESGAEAARQAGVVPKTVRRRASARTPRLREIEPPDPANVFERFLSDDERRRLAALEHLVDEDAPYDALGFSPQVARTAFPFFYGLYRFYFRVESEGHAQIPGRGPVILAGNHGGLLPLDGAMTVLDVLLHTDPPRLPRAIVEHWAGTLPWVNVFYARVGQVIGTRENFADLLDHGQLVLVYPEGVDGIRKPVSQRYRLQKFHMGFVEEALRARAPIIPVATIGSDDQTPILYDLKSIARWLGLPALPITPTFPWFGPLGLLPYPVRYRIVYGEPLDFTERHGPEDAKDPRLVRYLANQVRRALQRLVDRSR
ncbi:MAG: acyltransferase family protein [Deltaproteobacteria bacterium]|nr:MAG: acyltransferase family protein [Deltaproteobacteria bacterium]